MWVQWDNNTDSFQGMVRDLPLSLADRDSASLAQLGYRELISRKPEDEILRFPRLMGTSVFTRLEDGRVLQEWPQADFSVAAVRDELARLVKESAGRELAKTDWMFVRKLETGAEIDPDVVELRRRIRAHVDWVIEEKLPTLTPRELVDFKWYFPQSVGEELVDGVPTQFTGEAGNADREIRVAKEGTKGLWTVPADARYGDPTEPAHPADRVYPDMVVPPTPPEMPPPTTDGDVPSFEIDVPGDQVDPEGLPFTHVYPTRPEGADHRGKTRIHLDDDQEQK